MQGEIPANHDNEDVDRQPSDRPGSNAAPQAPDAGERALIAAILRRDRKAAARFVADYSDAVYAFARRRLAPRADLIDDVVQEVFLAALSGLAGFQGESSLRTWLLGIARHKIDDVFRQRLRLADSIEDTDAVVDTSPAITLDDRIDAERDRVKAQRVLAQLPERYALMLLRRYWERRRTRDIAAELGATEKSVERTLARARARFKQLWLKEQS